MSVNIINESKSGYPLIVDNVWNVILDQYDEEDLYFTKDQVYNCYKLAKSILNRNGYSETPEAIGIYGFGIRDIDYELLKKIYDSNSWDKDMTEDIEYIEAYTGLDQDKYGEFGTMSVGEDQSGKRLFVVAYNEL